jgi:hypothetical protein
MRRPARGWAWLRLNGVVVRVASLDDIIASKRAANRPKDIAALPFLEALADEIVRGH